MKDFKNVLITKRNKRGFFFSQALLGLVAIMSLFSGQISAQQPAILGTASASNQAVVFPDADEPGTQNLVDLPAGAQPHCVAYYGNDNALVADFASRVFVVQISTATLLSTIPTGPSYNGSGTIAVAPDQSAALAVGNDSTLNVIQGPFGPASTITQVALPGVLAVFQTQGIVFNNAGRAFVYHTAGISVLDPPYESIAFTIPVAFNDFSGAIAISPDGNTLLTTLVIGAVVQIFQAPFSPATTPTDLTIPGGNALDGIMVAPDGLSAIVVSSGAHHAAAITAPFSSGSVVETLPLPGGTGGFEDVGISADSQLAIITGNGGSNTEAPILIRAPFTAAGAVTSYIPIMGVANPGRGNGSVRFRPPGVGPGLTISKSAPATVASGANLTYTISYSNTGPANVADVVIRDPLPAGTTFVSATNGGTLIGGNVVFDLGTVNPGGAAQTVSFTVTVDTPAGGTVENNSYTIEGDGISPISGSPVTTDVTGAIPTPGKLLNISTRLRVLTEDNVLIGGFIITGTEPKTVIARAIGPALGNFGIANPLADPTLELNGNGLVVSNDNWRDTQETEIAASGLAPSEDLESAIIATLDPGAYTAIVRGVGGVTGVGLVETYDLDAAAGSLANISTRGFVETGDNVLIGGFIVGGGEASVLVRAIGPSLTAFGVPGALQDPTLELHDGSGTALMTNDDWKETQQAEIEAQGLAPGDDRESAILALLPPGGYTAIVRGASDTTGVGLVEVYHLE